MEGGAAPRISRTKHNHVITKRSRSSLFTNGVSRRDLAADGSALLNAEYPRPVAIRIRHTGPAKLVPDAMRIEVGTLLVIRDRSETKSG